MASSSRVGIAFSRESSRTVRPDRAAAFLKGASSPVGTTTEPMPSRKESMASATSASVGARTTFAE